MRERADAAKEERFLFFVQSLIEEHAAPTDEAERDGRHDGEAVAKACAWLEAHSGENVTLERLARIAGGNKYTLLRAFVRREGITPYRYLTTLRVGRAKHLLESGVPPVECAFRTGFSDQSHFTTTFRQLIGLTPKQYQRIFAEGGDRERPSRDGADRALPEEIIA